MKEPIHAKVLPVQTDDQYLVAEDARGIRYYLHTDRIVGDPPAKKPTFEDLLDVEEKEKFEELL